MPSSTVLIPAGGFRAADLCPVLRRMPPVVGAPVEVCRVRGLRDRRGPVHGGAYVRQRLIALACTRAELPRILVHEVFHFVWVRAGNPARHSWEAVLAGEIEGGARGELGWSAEWRKSALGGDDRRLRTRAWREYCCESFCDTAAWLYSGARRHPEFTLGDRRAGKRRDWFARELAARPLPV